MTTKINRDALTLEAEHNGEGDRRPVTKEWLVELLATRDRQGEKRLRSASESIVLTYYDLAPPLDRPVLVYEKSNISIVGSGSEISNDGSFADDADEVSPRCDVSLDPDSIRKAFSTAGAIKKIVAERTAPKKRR